MHGDKVRDYRDWGIPLGRRFRALKLWMTLQLLGTDSIKERIRYHISLAQKIEQWIVEDNLLEIAYPRSLNIVTFRLKKENDQDGRLTKLLVSEINDSGKAYMTHAVVEGRSLVRWVTGQTYVEEKHVIGTWDLLQTILHKII
jgi:aromatic-L-amino-acid decarboxylase